jgi:cytoskeletal protein CcmA (bactofilin family)
MLGSEHAKTVIAEDIEITGSLKGGTNIRLDGKLSGDLTAAGDVTLGHTGNIQGNLVVGSVSVLGRIQGNIQAEDRVELRGTAKLNGDLKAKRLVVEDGCTFVGHCEVTPAPAPARPAPATEPRPPAAFEPPKPPPPPPAHDEDRNRPRLFGRK